MTNDRRPRIQFVALLVTAIGCSSSSGTAVRLDLTYDSSWGLDGLTVTASGQSLDAPLAHTVRMAVPDGWAGQPINVVVWGNKGGEHFAGGNVTVTPILKQEISAQVELSRVPCGAWCTAGATECAGNNTVVCTANDRGCTDWELPTACPNDKPYCSLGVCGATCVDECAMGEQRCEGPNTLRLCGQDDSDTCLDWLPALPCGQGQICSNGACVAVCQNECTAGEVQCLGQGTVTCGDLDHDGCTEWGPIVPCVTGSCSAGRCSSSCTDDCTASMCAGNLFQMCGQFDLDSCKDLSPGVSCVPSDSCMEGRCTPTGCESAPKVCQAPPASTCKDSSTLTVYDTTGTCSAGTCTYLPHDVACPNCPACDACAGVTCNTPPSSCFKSIGTCTNGSCSYAYNDGAACSDNNACTSSDQCKSGVCSGTPISCTSPPAATCTSSTSLRTYSSPGVCSGAGPCSYPHVDMTCACSNGKCNTTSGWTTAAPLPTARRDLAAVAAPDGRIYAIGGLDKSGHFVSVVEVYTPSSNSWATVAPMPTARAWLGASMGPDGRIYAIGGTPNTTPLNTVEAYTPSTNSWATVAPMPTARYLLATAAGSDGRIYATGGWDGLKYRDTVETYDASTNTWVTAAALQHARGAHVAATGRDGRIYVFGGGDSNGFVNSTEIYASTNSWVTGASFPFAIGYFDAAAGANGYLYAMGGSGVSLTAVNSVEVYDPTHDTWATGIPMPTARQDLAAVTGADGRIYAIGGLDDTATTVGTVEVFTP